MRIDFEGQIHEFPDDFTDAEIASALGGAKPAAKQAPTVPFYVGDVNVNESPEVRQQFDSQVAKEEAGRAEEQKAFEASRTPMKRVRDAGTFALSLPVRAATRGEKGIGDVFGLVNEAAGANAKQSEADFARANQGNNALETAEKAARSGGLSGLLSSAGDVVSDIPTLSTLGAFGAAAPGIPLLNTMGGVPGQMTRTMGAATRQLPGEVKALMKGEEGSGPIPGGPAAPPPPTGPAAVPVPSPGGIPNRAETFAAQERLKTGIGADVDLPEAVVGAKYKQKFAGGVRSVPGAGEPIEMAYEKGIRQLGEAKSAAGATLGEAKGAEAAGGAIKQGGLDWIRKNSKDYLKEKYDAVASSVDQGITRPLTNTQKTVDQIAKEARISTTKDAAPALQMVEDAINRPEGLSAKGLQDLRSSVGRKIDAAKVVPDAAEASYKRLYAALDKDLQATLKDAGGDQALRAWQLANREARIVAGKRKRIAQVIGAAEDKLSDEAVFKKIQSIASENTSNLKNLRQMKEIVGGKQWGDMGAELLNRMGVDPKTNLFSGDRFLTAYGEMSDGGKHLVFGAAKQHLDDIAMIAKKYGELSGHFNRSNTGVVNAILRFANNPATMAVHAVTSPLSAVGQVGGTAALRAAAWSLARPAQAGRVSNVLKAYVRVASAAERGSGALATHERGLAAAIRTYAQGAAQEIGGNADDIAAQLQKTIDEARNGGSQ